MKKLKLLHTLVLLDYGECSLRLVYVPEELITKLEQDFDNNVEAWIDDCLAEDIGIYTSNCHWMLVSGKVSTYEHRMNNNQWNVKQMYWV